MLSFTGNVKIMLLKVIEVGDKRKINQINEERVFRRFYRLTGRCLLSEGGVDGVCLIQLFKK